MSNCPGATLLTLADGASMYRQGAACRHAYVLIDGLVMLSRVTADGQRLALAVLSRGDWLGSLTGAGVGCEAEETVEAKGLVRLCRVAHADLKIWLAGNPDYAWDLIERVEAQRRHLVKKLESLVTRDVRARLAETLRELLDRFGDACEHGFGVHIRLTQQELADLVGASRPVVSTILNDLRDQGILGYSRDLICVSRLDALQDLLVA
jgi:CRP-like cAMP-binding protein